MGSICFSSASILRCTLPSSELKSVLLIIPTALEAIFATSLVFANWKSGSRKHLFLTAEGWMYLALSLGELVRAIVPGVRNNVQLFQMFDVGIGVASFLPIFFYTFFLFLFTSNDLVDALPKNIRNVAKLSLILFLPAIVVFNEIASFVGVKIDSLPTENNTSSSVVTLGFTSAHEELLWTFFTSTTLALLIVYQAAVFCFSFFRLGQAIIGQRRIKSEGADKAHFVNGVGWLCIGLKLGALESVVGFAGGAFGVNITRRLMRMIARGCLCTGIIKGVDTVEDFHVVQRELKLNSANRQERKSGLRHFISNPRLSTFRQLSPTATSFHASNATKPFENETGQASKKSAHYSTWSQRQSALLQNGLPGMQAFASVKEARSNQRVTISYQGGTPRLHMRFSSFDTLNPSSMVEKVEKAGSRRNSQYLGSYQGTTSVQLPYASDDFESMSDLPAPEAYFHKEHAGSISYRDSLNSAPSLGPYEIIDARRLSQKAAMAQMYTPSSAKTRNSPVQADEIAIPEPTYQMSSPPLPVETSKVRDSSKYKSVISVTDSIQAMRELTAQFPGPPGISQLRPSENMNRSLPKKIKKRDVVRPPTPTGLTEQSVWEDDSRASAQYLSPGLPIPQVIGSPSQLSFSKTQISSVGADENVHSSVTSHPRAGKVPVTPGGYRRMSTSSRHRSHSSSFPKPIEPSEEEFDLSSLQPTKNPIYAPVGMPLRQSLKLNTVLSPQASKGPLTAAEFESPSTALSQLTRLREDGIEQRIDPFLDFATALDTGKSKQFRPSLPPLPEPTPRRIAAIPTPERNMSRAEERYFRIEQWVNTSANTAVIEHEIPESPVTIVTPTMTPTMVGTSVDDKLYDDKMSDRAPVRENNLQNLHDRGPSIDALSIAWPKDPNAPTSGDRAVGGAAAAAGTQAALARVATVGKAPSRTTPTPMLTHAVRGSLHLQPIVVPPRSGNLPQIEYETIESPVTRKVSAKDSDVLDMEDSLRRMPRQSTARRF